nr:TetR/AcrR family transcriptional regulator [uncultured Bacillus sp.]
MEQRTGTDVPKKELILQATLDLIKEEGFEGVTIRKIAALANVNVALINYHFGSKDKLLNMIIHYLVSDLKHSFMVLDDDSIDPRERLKQFLIQYLNTFRQYPFIIRKLVDSEPLEFESHLEFITFLRLIGLQKVRQTIQELSGEDDPDTLTIMMSHILGAVFLPPLIEPLYETVTGDTFTDVESQVEILLNHYFAQ